MKESMPSSAQPPHAAQKPRTWLEVSFVVDFAVITPSDLSHHSGTRRLSSGDDAILRRVSDSMSLGITSIPARRFPKFVLAFGKPLLAGRHGGLILPIGLGWFAW